MSYIEFKNVGKRYGAQALFNDLSFSIKKGEIVNICGPTGCGKSVILKLLSGVEQVDAGEICINGVNISSEDVKERNLGIVFQEFSLYPHLTCFENIASPLRAKKLAKNVVVERVQRTASMLKIDKILAHYPREISNGQKQRTAFARALIKEPAIICLDDPLKNVDAKLSYEMRLEIPHILSKFNSTALYVTQDFKEAMALGDRILVLMEGRTVQFDTPQQIYHAPATLEVAKFFGDPAINYFTVAATPCRPPTRSRKAATNGVQFNLFGKKFSFKDIHVATLGRQQQALTVGIRSEDFILSAKQTKIARYVKMEVLSYTPLNVRFIFLLRSIDGKEIFASVPEDQGERLRKLKHVYVTFQNRALHFFAAKHGTCLPITRNSKIKSS